MTHYLLSVHGVEGGVREPMTDEEMQQSHKQLGVLEGEMKSAGAWVVSGRLHGPDTATVVRMADGEPGSGHPGPSNPASQRAYDP
jgi:hypothetical protein